MSVVHQQMMQCVATKWHLHSIRLHIPCFPWNVLLLKIQGNSYYALILWHQTSSVLPSLAQHPLMPSLYSCSAVPRVCSVMPLRQVSKGGESFRCQLWVEGLQATSLSSGEPLRQIRRHNIEQPTSTYIIIPHLFQQLMHYLAAHTPNT